MRPTLVAPSSNWATVTPAIPSLWTAAGAAAPVTSAPARSTTSRAGCASLNALKSGFCVPCTTTRGPSTSMVVMRFAPAEAFAGSAAQRTSAAAVQMTCSFILFSWPTLAAPLGLRRLRRRHHFFALSEGLEVRLLFLRLRDLDGDVLRIDPAGIPIGNGLGHDDLIALDRGDLSPVLADEIADAHRPATRLRILEHRHRGRRCRDGQDQPQLVERPLLQRGGLAAFGRHARLPFGGE